MNISKNNLVGDINFVNLSWTTKDPREIFLSIQKVKFNFSIQCQSFNIQYLRSQHIGPLNVEKDEKVYSIEWFDILDASWQIPQHLRSRTS